MVHKDTPYSGFRIVTFSILLILAFSFLVFEVVKSSDSYGYGSMGTGDFIQYWSSGQLFISGDNPYDCEKGGELQVKIGRVSDRPLIMLNPPWVLIWIYPLLHLPFAKASLIWLVINLSLIFLSGAAIWYIINNQYAWRRILITPLFLLLFPPVFFSTLSGQISSLVLFGIVGFLFFITRDRPFLAGLFLALATIKPHIVYLLWVAVVYSMIKERNWRLFAGFNVMVGASVSILMILSPNCIFHYIEHLSRHPPYSEWYTPTIGGFLYMLLGKDWSSVVFLPPIIASIIFFGFLFFREEKRFDWITMISPILLISLPTSVYGGWTSDMIILLIPYLSILSRLFGEGSAVRGRGLLIILCLLFISAGMILEYKMRIPEPFFIWVPLTLAILYYATNAASSGLEQKQPDCIVYK